MFINKKAITILVFTLIFGIASSSGAAAYTMEFSPKHDTYITSSYPNNSFGHENSMQEKSAANAKYHKKACTKVITVKK